MSGCIGAPRRRADDRARRSGATGRAGPAHEGGNSKGSAVDVGPGVASAHSAHPAISSSRLSAIISQDVVVPPACPRPPAIPHGKTAGRAGAPASPRVPDDFSRMFSVPPADPRIPRAPGNAGRPRPRRRARSRVQKTRCTGRASSGRRWFTTRTPRRYRDRPHRRGINQPPRRFPSTTRPGKNNRWILRRPAPLYTGPQVTVGILPRSIDTAESSARPPAQPRAGLAFTPVLCQRKPRCAALCWSRSVSTRRFHGSTHCQRAAPALRGVRPHWSAVNSKLSRQQC